MNDQFVSGGRFLQKPYSMNQLETSVGALLNVKGGQYTVKSYNDAVRSISDFKTDILCQPWYYGRAPLHIPNNVDWTTTPQGGKMVIKEGCFKISDVDPDIAKVRKIEAADPSLIGK